MASIGPHMEEVLKILVPLKPHQREDVLSRLLAAQLIQAGRTYTQCRAVLDDAIREITGKLITEEAPAKRRRP